jgi:hypothetical protein
MERLLATIADPRASTPALIDAIRQLEAVTEPARFWSAIANSATYRPDHRRQAVFALFRRHVTPGMTLADLARLLDNPAWLHDDDISVVTVLGGKIPVQWTFDDTVFMLGVFPALAEGRQGSWAIYLRVAGHVDRARFADALHGRPAPDEVRTAQLREVGFSPADPSARDG